MSLESMRSDFGRMLALDHQIFVADRDGGKHVAFDRLSDRKPTTAADARTRITAST